MKNLFTVLLLTSLTIPLWAAETRYELKIDGLACPYCAYGIEKKIKAIDGVDQESIEVKLNEGQVAFLANTEPLLTEDAMKTLINDAGFTLRKFTALPIKPEK